MTAEGLRLTGLNPFEVREVLQVVEAIQESQRYCLNPFEVREVLQVIAISIIMIFTSQSL